MSIASPLAVEVLGGGTALRVLPIGGQSPAWGCCLSSILISPSGASAEPNCSPSALLLNQLLNGEIPDYSRSWNAHIVFCGFRLKPLCTALFSKKSLVILRSNPDLIPHPIPRPIPHLVPHPIPRKAPHPIPRLSAGLSPRPSPHLGGNVFGKYFPPDSRAIQPASRNNPTRHSHQRTSSISLTTVIAAHMRLL